MNEQHLYRVDIEYTNGDQPRKDAFTLIGTLNILVPKEGVGPALSKARRFLSQNKAKYVGAAIKGIKYGGTIDEVAL